MDQTFKITRAIIILDRGSRCPVNSSTDVWPVEKMLSCNAALREAGGKVEHRIQLLKKFRTYWRSQQPTENLLSWRSLSLCSQKEFGEMQEITTLLATTPLQLLSAREERRAILPEVNIHTPSSSLFISAGNRKAYVPTPLMHVFCLLVSPSISSL